MLYKSSINRINFEDTSGFNPLFVTLSRSIVQSITKKPQYSYKVNLQ